MKKHFQKLIPLVVMLSMLTWGCAQSQKAQDTSAKAPAAQKQEENVYKGKVLGKSNKAKSISIEVGKGDKAKTLMVKFDDKTTGLEFAKKGEAAIIKWEQRGKDKVATVIKPKLAKLPEGIAEVKIDELKDLVASKADLAIIDSRPGKRYAQSHLPGAISIPADPDISLAVFHEPKSRRSGEKIWIHKH